MELPTEEVTKPKRTRRPSGTNKDGFKKGEVVNQEDYFKYMAQKRLQDAKKR